MAKSNKKKDSVTKRVSPRIQYAVDRKAGNFIEVETQLEAKRKASRSKSKSKSKSTSMDVDEDSPDED